MKKIVLFDMDGTTTPARKSMPRDIAEKLFILHNRGYDIGIISGSGLNYILEQCDVFFKMYGTRLDNLKIYPCNGTKYFKWNVERNEPEKVYNSSIRTELGDSKLKRVLNALLNYQIDLMNNYEFSSRFNYTGTFVDYRESMINWCPIGRNANFSDRAIFEDLDEYFKIRERFSRVLTKDPVFTGLSIKIGGATSFDIYPHGWDKTLPLLQKTEQSNLKDCEIIFVGDRCEPGGNDYELYSYIQEKNSDNAYKTSGPDETILIIDNILER